MTYPTVFPSMAGPFATEAAGLADPSATSSVFATGAAVGGTGPDSITTGGGSVWVEYANTGVSTGGGKSEIVQYSLAGAVQHKHEIAGLVDGLKVDPVTGMVWALQNQDGNSTLSLINPATHHVSNPLKYASPPYVYGPNSSRGYDDVAFLDGKVYLSYTNPVHPKDPVVQILDNGNNPSGTLTTTTILRASQTGIPTPDIDSLKSTPSGELVLTSEGDGPGTGNPFAEFTLISHPGAANQTEKTVTVTNAKGQHATGMDDVLFPNAIEEGLSSMLSERAPLIEVRTVGFARCFGRPGPDAPRPSLQSPSSGDAALNIDLSPAPRPDRSSSRGQ